MPNLTVLALGMSDNIYQKLTHRLEQNDLGVFIELCLFVVRGEFTFKTGIFLYLVFQPGFHGCFKSDLVQQRIAEFERQRVNVI